jgi:hypothetical protein
MLVKHGLKDNMNFHGSRLVKKTVLGYDAAVDRPEFGGGL